MDLTHINFANPVWLWALLIISSAWLIGLLWKKVQGANLNILNKFIDKELLPHILLNRATKVTRNYNGVLYSLLLALIIIAMANPRWSYEDIDAFQPTASMVIVLDLAASMNADDVSPSRIMRARQYIEDLLNMSHGLKFGLIGFAGQAHLISPVTDDVQTIKTYVPALDTDLTNKQGDSLYAALNMAGDLLSAEPGDKKSVLLISDGNFATTGISRELSALKSAKIQVHVVGVGTLNGAPYRNNAGSLQKSQGKVITSRLNDVELKEIAKLGSGIYTEATYSEVGLKAILSKAEQREQEHIIAGKVRQWEDKFYVFLIPAAMILLYLMRSRVLLGVVLAVTLNGVMTKDAYAYSFKELFLNSEQSGQAAYVEGDFKTAADKFQDPYRKGVAFYRGGQYSAAEEQFSLPQRQELRLDAMYNAGNAQMQQQKWQAAVKSYESVLNEDPDNFAAAHNLEIARKMLAEDPEQAKNDCDCDNKDQNGEQNDQSSKNDKNNKNESDKNSAKEDSNENEKNQDTAENNSSQEKEQPQNKAQNKSNDSKQANNDHVKPQDTKDQTAKNDPKENADDQNNQPEPKKANMASLQRLDPEDEARIEQWINRVDSDIKIFLKNKFYVEDMLGAQ